MEDYYRVRFAKLQAPPGKRSPSHPIIPRPLRIVYRTSIVVAAVGWVAGVLFCIRGSAISSSAWAPLVALVMPVAATLALGFQEDQPWTRPLLVALVALPTAAWVTSGHVALAASGLAVAGGVTLYVYRSPPVRAYYAFLRDQADLRLGAGELRSAVFVPLYASWAGILAGIGLGSFVVVRGMGDSFHGAANDLVAVVGASVIAAALLGTLARWLAEALLARRHRKG